MRKIALLTLALLMVSTFLSAQKKDEPKKKKTAGEVINELPEMLIAQPTVTDTTADKLVEDNLYILINPLWKKQGLQTILDFKVLKTDKDPLVSTFPLPEKKLNQGLVINMNTIKKSPAEKKQALLTQIKNHITAFYKDNQKEATAAEIMEKANSMLSGPESLTTSQGKTGELYFANDIETKQSNYIILLLIPGDKTGTTIFVQFTYFHYNYETTAPEDIYEWRQFTLPDDQKAFIDFTKGILKTLIVK